MTDTSTADIPVTVAAEPPAAPNIAVTGATEIIVVASGKGGTGKTTILATLGYALQRSGLRILFIDADTATDGLSLFLLGPEGMDALGAILPQNTFAGYLQASHDGTAGENWTSAYSVNRGAANDHGLVYDALLSGRGLYGNLPSEIMQATSPPLDQDGFRAAVRKLFAELKASKRWDYVLIDTRGGFGYMTTDVCAMADSFFIVTESNPSSFFQDKSLITRISASASDLGVKPHLRGVVVNKATDLGTASAITPGVHDLNLKNVELKFRELVTSAFGIRYDDTYAVPIDLDAVLSYKWQQIVYVGWPSSVFAYATITVFSGLMKVVTAQWPKSVLAGWNALVDTVSAAVDQENKQAEEEARKKNAIVLEKAQLESDLTILRARADDLKVSAERSDFNEHYWRVRIEKIEAGRRWLTFAMFVALSALAGSLLYNYFQAARIQDIPVTTLNLRAQISSLQARTVMLQSALDGSAAEVTVVKKQNATLQEQILSDTARMNDLSTIIAQLQAQSHVKPASWRVYFRYQDNSLGPVIRALHEFLTTQGYAAGSPKDLMNTTIDAGVRNEVRYFTNDALNRSAADRLARTVNSYLSLSCPGHPAIGSGFYPVSAGAPATRVEVVINFACATQGFDIPRDRPKP